MSNTVHLTLNSEYVPGWGMKEGLRELIQNWMDAGGQGIPTYNDGKLTLDNPTASMSKDSLLIGSTSKAGVETQRGEFGEGLKLGTLALLREGVRVEVDVPGERWVAKLDNHPVLHKTVLAWDILPTHREEGVLVSVLGLTGDDWGAVRRMFIWGRDCMESFILEQKDMKGAVYVKGIHVFDHDNLAYGYNFYNLPTDRDRKLVDNYQLAQSAGSLLVKSMEDGAFSATALLKIIMGNTMEAQHISGYSMLNEGKQKMTDAWNTLYKDTIPVVNRKEKDKLDSLGMKTLSVSSRVPEMLLIPKAKDVIETALASSTEITDLTDQEKENMLWAQTQMHLATGQIITVKVCAFNYAGIGSIYQSGNIIAVARENVKDEVGCLLELVRHSASILGGYSAVAERNTLANIIRCLMDKEIQNV